MFPQNNREVPGKANQTIQNALIFLKDFPSASFCRATVVWLPATPKDSSGRGGCKQRFIEV
jgi:hypothetical protein